MRNAASYRPESPFWGLFLVFQVISLLLHIEIFLNSHRMIVLWPSNYSESLKKIWQQDFEKSGFVPSRTHILRLFLVFQVISLLLHIEIFFNSHRMTVLWPSNYFEILKKIWHSNFEKSGFVPSRTHILRLFHVFKLFQHYKSITHLLRCRKWWDWSKLLIKSPKSPKTT